MNHIMKTVFGFGTLAIAALFATSAMAYDVRLDLDGGQVRLPECGGTVEATRSSYDTQVNFIVRHVEQCSNFDLDGQNYKIPGSNTDRSGSFTLTARELHYGWNQLTLTIQSNSGKHSDTVAIWIYKTGNNTGHARPEEACRDDAARYANQEVGYNRYDRYDAHFDRVSNSGNYVFNVGRYEVVVSSTCQKKNVSHH